MKKFDHEMENPTYVGMANNIDLKDKNRLDIIVNIVESLSSTYLFDYSLDFVQVLENNALTKTLQYNMEIFEPEKDSDPLWRSKRDKIIDVLENYEYPYTKTHYGNKDIEYKRLVPYNMVFKEIKFKTLSLTVSYHKTLTVGPENQFPPKELLNPNYD